MSGHTQSNGRSDSKRPLTTLIEREEDIIAESDIEMNPNYAGHVDGSGAEVQALKQQVESLRQQIAFLTENGAGDDGQSARNGAASGSDGPKVEREDLSGRSSATSGAPSEEDRGDDRGNIEAIFATARDKVGGYLDAEAVKAQLDELRAQVAGLSDRLPMDRGSVRSIKDDIVAPAVAAALPSGLGQLGETAVRKITLDTVARYGIPTAILLAAIRLSSPGGKEGTS